jgi:hypothetical protein
LEDYIKRLSLLLIIILSPLLLVVCGIFKPVGLSTGELKIGYFNFYFNKVGYSGNGKIISLCFDRRGGTTLPDMALGAKGGVL